MKPARSEPARSKAARNGEAIWAAVELETLARQSTRVEELAAESNRHSRRP